MDSKPIASGRTADIYAWREGTVLKLFHVSCPSNWADQEFEINQAVYKAGLPVPAVEEVIHVDGRRGIIFERITGPTILDHIKNKPWSVAACARLLASLHSKMHKLSLSLDWLPYQRQELEGAINYAAGLPTRLPEHLKQAALDKLKKLPDGNALCHGDFHLENVVLSPRGPVILDWMTAYRGEPAGDVARTYLIMSIGDPPPDAMTRLLVILLRKTCCTTYLKHYIKLSGIPLEHIQAWALPVAAARWAENIKGEAPYLLNIMENAIK
jgi:aminoglycoside phosphotransferase (APT) family kinase protein